MLAIFSAQLLAQNEDGEAAHRVVDGTIVNVGDYPWMVSLAMSDGSAGCGASLIAPQWVLTAGHCITNDFPFPGVPLVEQVIINSITNNAGNLESFSELINVDSIFIHEDYAGIFAGGTGPDIALIRLSEPATTSPVALAEYADSSLYAHQMPGIVLGWGLTETGGEASDTLRVGMPSFFSQDSCAASYASSSSGVYEANAGGTICAGYFAGDAPTGAASGDSGGPLFFEDNGVYKQVGVVSGGESDITTEDFPGIYTFVPKYRDWIDNIMETNAVITSVFNAPAHEEGIFLYQSDDVLTINGLNTNDEYAISIFSISGRLVNDFIPNQGNSAHELFTSNYNSGFYFVTIRNFSRGFITTKKVMLK